jgi:signal transduction histidine kinase
MWVTKPPSKTSSKTNTVVESRLTISPRLFFQDHGLAALVFLYQIAVLACFVIYPLLAFPFFGPPGPGAASFLIPYGIGLLYLACSFWVLSFRRRDAVGRTFSLLCSAAGLVFAGLYDLNTSRALLYLWSISLALASGGLLNLGLLFPVEVRFRRRFPITGWLGYLPALFLSITLLPAAVQPTGQTAFSAAWRIEAIYLGFAVAIFLALNAWRAFSHPSPIVREIARLLLWSALISFGPAALWRLAVSLWPGLDSSLVLLLPAGIFPLVLALSVLRGRLLNTDYLLSQGLLFALLSIFTVAGYALLVSGLSLVFGAAVPARHPLLIGLLVFALAVAFNPARLYLQRLVDRYFFRSQPVYRERLQSFSSALTQIVELQQILHHLRETVQAGLYPAPLHIFIYDPLGSQYMAAPQPGKRPSTDLLFPASSPLVSSLSSRRSSLFLIQGELLPVTLEPERARLALLGAQLFVPLPGRQRLAGWLALGPRRSGEGYDHRDLSYLEALCDQAALAVERAQVVADLERRVREMNTLTRIAQGLNVTLAFDDILELIYAQTSQVIPCRDFWITLVRADTHHFVHAFFLQNDERQPQLENKPVLEGLGLGREVWRERRSIIAEDYERECRARGVTPLIPGLQAWMGVPLNAGSETIGSISLGSRDPAVTFSASQAALFQAIADQAAGAMVKARLLQETERRARQLASLNEIGRSLTSTLEPRPLLDGILNHAVEIINCEAGSLFLVDRATGELVFEVTAGPVAGDLLGQRLPPGTGLVGRAVSTGQPVIVNHVQTDKGWFDKADRQTGFVTRNLLVVPMLAKDRVTGVIEVINKLDGLPFTRDDEKLLSTFASQAAVAVENAHLYTQTDKALGARVEELSVMQRIGRELNASLDLDRTLRITLAWSVQQTRADAGLVGLVRDGGLEVLASLGYSIELEVYRQGAEGAHPFLPAELPALQNILENANPQVKTLSATSETPTVPIPSRAAQDPALLGALAQQGFLLAGARQQAAVPIRREAEVNAVLLLESRQPGSFSDENLTFLSRLSDHAAMAISNAQLYAAVQAANLAKSEFVSFVSHELKTPMTSIKGYADLLAAGAVGPVNEAQASFLNTIRTNVNRMATLVSDLADVSRIEAGRLRLEFSAVPVAELVNDVTGSARRQIDEKSQVLDLDVPPGLPPVWGDRNRLIQVLANLVSNANKYTPAEGRITITAGCVENRWDPKGVPFVIHLAVQDTGYGIQPADQKKIFQKFFRSEDQNIRNTPGTGLGLNITRHLVEIQGGRIWFESEPGKGTSFHFTVPISSN